MKHNHRILPGHMGGEYVEGNVISVEVTNCDRNTANHVMWHFANWCLYGKEEDRAAYKGLSGCYSKEEIIEERLRLAGKKTGRMHAESGHIQEIGRINGKRAMSPGGWLYENRSEYGRLGGLASYPLGLGRISSEERARIARKTWEEGRGLAVLTTEQRREIGSRNGKVSGAKHRDNKTGVCGIPPEEHSRRMSDTNRQKWQCPVCGLVSNAKKVNAHMKEEHNLPKDAKNKFNSAK